MNIKDLLFLLSGNDSAGYIEDSAILAEKELKKYCETERNNLTVIGFLKGESDYTLMIDAHIDQIGMVVTNIDDNGFFRNISGVVCNFEVDCFVGVHINC